MRRWCIAAVVGGLILTLAASPDWVAPTFAGGGSAVASTTNPAGPVDPPSFALNPSPPSTAPSFRTGRGFGYTAADWELVVRFMKRNSPYRLAFIRTLPEGPRRAAMSAAAVQDFRAYERARADPDLSHTLLTRLHLEDELFDLAGRLRQAPPEQQSELREQLRQKVGQWTDATFQERAQRIDRLKQTLESQESTLAADLARRDTIVNDRFREVMRTIHLASTRPSTAPATTAPAVLAPILTAPTITTPAAPATTAPAATTLPGVS